MGDLTSVPGSLHRGDGIVARWPGVVLVIPAHRQHDAAAAELIEELGPSPHRDQVVKMVHDLIVNRNGLVGAALVVETDNGLGTMAFGATEILIDDVTALTGTDGPNTDLIGADDVRQVTVGASSLQASNRTSIFNLRLGIAPAAGITLDFSGSPMPSADLPPSENLNGARPASKQPPVQAPRQYSSHGVPPVGYEEPRQPDPSEPLEPSLQARQPAQASQPGPAWQHQHSLEPPVQEAPIYGSTGNHAVRVMVEGVVCDNNHFNDPRLQYCSRCMTSIHSNSLLMHGYRPSLGYLLFDDGLAYDLDRSYVIGREPGEVDNSHTDALALSDEKEIMSRVHAEIRLVDWDVQIVDANSTNGSYLWSSNENRWLRLPPNQGVQLPHGAKVMLGSRSFSYEQPSDPN